MLKLKSGGMVNEDELVALVQRGPNWVALFSSGHELVIDKEDADALIADAGVAPSPKK